MVATVPLKSIRPFACGVLAVLLAACGGGSSGGGGSTTYAIGGNITGLTGTVVLQNNGGDNLSRSSNGKFTFATRLASGATYNVSVLTQPAGQICEVNDHTGTATGNISDIPVVCTSGFMLGGVVSGLTGTLVLGDAGSHSDSVLITTGGTFHFPKRIRPGQTYDVRVFRQPAGQTCSVAAAGTGTASADVENVGVSCVANPYTVGGMVSGLASGTVALQLNYTDTLTVGNGPFTFPKPLAAGTVYTASVVPGSAGTHSCAVANSIGAANSNVSSVNVTCTPLPATASLGGTVQGLAGTVVLVNSVNGETATRTTNGSFTFPTALALGSGFAVAVQVQPAGQICSVQNPAGNVLANSSNIFTVECLNGTETHTVSGMVNGLKGTLQLGMNIDNGFINVSPPASGPASFNFPVPLQFDKEFKVFVRTQPAGQTCLVPHASTIVAHADITDIVVTCVDNSTDTLVGTYTSWNRDFVLTFYGGGVYVFASRFDDPGCGASKGNGVEVGSYRYNASAGTLAFINNVLDTNGSGCGVWTQGATAINGTLTKTGSGQGSALVLTPMAGADPLPLVPVPTTSYLLQGSYFFPGGLSFLVFDDDGHFLEVNANDDPADDAPAGIEYGCYSTAGTSTGTFTPTFSTATCPGAIDTDHTAGLSGAADTAIQFSVNQGFGVFDNETVAFRIIPN